VLFLNIYEIAQKAGVSIATVSRVINKNPHVSPRTRKKVEAVLREYNYTPNAIARSLVINSTRTIGIMVSDIRDSYYANATYTIEQEFKKLGYNVILCNTGMQLEEKKKYLKILLEKKVDGMILVGSVFKEINGNNHILEAAQRVPIVMLNSYLEGRNVFSIVCDDALAVHQIVSVLVQRSYKEIVYFYDVDSFSGMAKIEGFKRGVKAAGLPLHSYSIMKVPSGFSGGQEGVRKLIKSGIPFDAIVASEDIIAAGVLKALRKYEKKVPEEVGVFGFNNSLITRCTVPELSSVDNKVEAMGAGAVQILKAALDGKEAPSKTVIAPDLVLRESC
jgi:LacI family transcriptional regulator